MSPVAEQSHLERGESALDNGNNDDEEATDCDPWLSSGSEVDEASEPDYWRMDASSTSWEVDAQSSLAEKDDGDEDVAHILALEVPIGGTGQPLWSTALSGLSANYQ